MSRKLLLAALLFVAPAASIGGSAAVGPRVEPMYDAPLEALPGASFKAVTVNYAPGGTSKPHQHPNSAIVFAYVLSGHVESQVEGSPLRTYGPGEHWVEGPGAHHLVSRNASRREPASMLAILVLVSPPAGAGDGSGHVSS